MHIRRHRELITIAESFEIRDEGRLQGEAAARCVRDVAFEHARELRELVARRQHGLDRWTDHQLIEHLAREVGMLCGQYAVSRRSVGTFGTPAVRQDRQPEPEAGPATSWIEFEIRNDSGAALADTRFELETPDGSVIGGTLDANGRGSVRVIEAPGTCTLRLPNFVGSLARA